MNESTWMSELEKIYKVPDGALTTEEIADKIGGIGRTTIQAFVCKACKNGTMKYAGRKEGVTMDGRKCQKPAYVFIKRKK